MAWVSTHMHVQSLKGGTKAKKKEEGGDPVTSICTLASGPFDARGVDNSKLFRASLRVRDVILRAMGGLLKDSW